MAASTHPGFSVANGDPVPILTTTEMILLLRRQVDSRRVPHLRRYRNWPHPEIGPRRVRRRHLRPDEISDLATMYAAGERLSVIAGKYDLTEDDVRDLANASKVTRDELHRRPPCAA